VPASGSGGPAHRPNPARHALGRRDYFPGGRRAVCALVGAAPPRLPTSPAPRDRTNGRLPQLAFASAAGPSSGGSLVGGPHRTERRAFLSGSGDRPRVGVALGSWRALVDFPRGRRTARGVRGASRTGGTLSDRTSRV